MHSVHDDVMFCQTEWRSPRLNDPHAIANFNKNGCMIHGMSIVTGQVPVGKELTMKEYAQICNCFWLNDVNVFSDFFCLSCSMHTSLSLPKQPPQRPPWGQLHQGMAWRKEIGQLPLPMPWISLGGSRRSDGDLSWWRAVGHVNMLPSWSRLFVIEEYVSSWLRWRRRGSATKALKLIQTCIHSVWSYLRYIIHIPTARDVFRPFSLDHERLLRCF